ncbi:hypothetical protein PR002_g31854, partial [Phytophthora rubi]
MAAAAPLALRSRCQPKHHQRHKKRRARKAVDQETPVFTNKFQNLLSFAFDNTSSEPLLPWMTSKQPETAPEMSSLDLLDGINTQDEQRAPAAVDDQQAAGDCARDVVAGPAGRHQQAGDNGPERTLVQLDLDGFDYDDDASFAKKQPRHPRQKPKKTKLFSGDKDPSTVLAALGIPSDGEGDRNDGPPISRKSIKMNTKRKKG